MSAPPPSDSSPPNLEQVTTASDTDQSASVPAAAGAATAQDKARHAMGEGAAAGKQQPQGRKSAPLLRHPPNTALRPIKDDDPLELYMRDVQRYPLLAPDEEHALAVRYVEEGDVHAARTLVTSNLRLVVKIAYDYRRAYRNILDLVQEGNIGLMQAVKKYDPYKGVKLSSYAAWWIRAYILRFVLNNWRLVKVGTTQAQRKLFFNLQKEKAKLSAMGIEATPERIAKRLQVSKQEVVSMDRRLSSGEVSLDAPVGHQDSAATTTRIELLPSEGADQVGDSLADAQWQALMHASLERFGHTLQGKEAVIFTERLRADEPATLQALGERFGVSRERVRQLEKRLLGKLRQHMQTELGDELETPT